MEINKLHGKEMGGNQTVNGHVAPTSPIRHDNFFQIFVVTDVALSDITACMNISYDKPSERRYG